MSRIDSNRDVYETWPIEVRQAVLDGKVEPGMTPDMVLVAMGKPTEIVSRSNRAGEDEIWVYSKGGHEGSVMYPGGGMGYPSGGMGGVSNTGTIGIISGGGGGTRIGTSVGTGIGVGVGSGGIGMGGGGGMGGPMITQPTPAEIREVVFRNGVVYRADPPPTK